jgi:hypothetical protein
MLTAEMAKAGFYSKPAFIIPGNHLLSPVKTTIGRNGLSFCVRNGHRRFPVRKVTSKSLDQALAQFLLSLLLGPLATFLLVITDRLPKPWMAATCSKCTPSPVPRWDLHIAGTDLH